MSVQAPYKTGFDKWKDGIKQAVNNPKWNEWDCEIQMSVTQYNRHLSSTSGYIPLDWTIIKAMLWVETGAERPEWKTNPMQIGVAGDPGLAALLSGNEGGELILPPAIKGKITTSSASAIPAYNIRAGIGYLLMRMAKFEYQSVLSSDKTIYEIIVKSGDSLDKIAKINGSSIDNLKTLNPNTSILQQGQIIKYQKASVKRVITGWRTFTTLTIAIRYNSMRRDPNYAKKLDFALNLIKKGKTSSCEH